MTALDEYGNVDSSYNGAQCVAFAGPTASPDGTMPIYSASGTCTGGYLVTFAAGVAAGSNAPLVTLFDAGGGVLTAQDVASGTSGFAGLTVTPGGPKTFALGATANQVAGIQFPVSLTALDLYGNTDTNYSGSHCIVFSGASNAPDGTEPGYPEAGSCTSGDPVTFASGVAEGQMSCRSPFSTLNRPPS